MTRKKNIKEFAVIETYRRIDAAFLFFSKANDYSIEFPKLEEVDEEETELYRQLIDE
jgi:hypothetical protein